MIGTTLIRAAVRDPAWKLDRHIDAKVRLAEKIEVLHKQMQWLQSFEEAIKQAPDHQVSLIDPDARSMATSGKGTGIVGYNVQVAVKAEHHLIVSRAATNVGHDRTQLVPMSR